MIEFIISDIAHYEFHSVLELFTKNKVLLFTSNPMNKNMKLLTNS